MKGERIHRNNGGGGGGGVGWRSGLGWMVNIDDLCTQQTECGGQGCLLVIIVRVESYLCTFVLCNSGEGVWADEGG